MIKINLLPPEIVAARKQKALQAKFVGLVMLLAAVMAVGYGGLFFLTMQVRVQKDDVVSRRQAMETQVAGYAPVVALQGDVNKMSGLVKTAMGAQRTWRETLGAIGVKIPANVWLTNYSMVFEKEAGQLLVRGLTYDHPSTARWVESLAGVAGISDVRCLFSAEETADNKSVVRFELRAVVAVGGEFDPLQKRGE